MRFEIFATSGPYLSDMPSHTARFMEIPAKYGFRVLHVPRRAASMLRGEGLSFEESAFIDIETPEELAELSHAIVRKLIIDNAPKGPEIEIYNGPREGGYFSRGREWIPEGD